MVPSLNLQLNSVVNVIKNVIEAENLRKSYKDTRGRRVNAVNDVSFSVQQGEVLALLGPNGAGKTSTIKILSGLLSPTTGLVRIVGRDPYESSDALRYIGSVMEGNRNLYWRMTSFENLVYFGVLKGMSIRDARRRSKQLLEEFDLSEKKDIQVRSLSRGMQQRVAIAVSMVHEPSILLLDEPALGLDAQSTIEVKRMIRGLVDNGVGVLLTTHQFDIAEDLSDRVAIIDKGKIIKVQETKDLLRQHANNTYEIYMQEKISSEQKFQIVQLPFKVECNDDYAKVACRPEDLYKVLKVLEPIPLQKVIRHKSDLCSVYLKLTGAVEPEEELYCA